MDAEADAKRRNFLCVSLCQGYGSFDKKRTVPFHFTTCQKHDKVVYIGHPCLGAIELMKHFGFLLYLLSYTSGIGALTLFAFFYIKYRHPLILRLIYVDLFFTLSLLMDTLNYYSRMIGFSLTTAVAYWLIIGIFLGSAGIAYNLELLVRYSVNLIWGRRQKLVFAFIAILAVAIINISFFLSQKGVFSEYIGIHTGFSVSNFFIVGWFFYCASLVIRNRTLLQPEAKTIAKPVLVVSSIVLPVSFGANLVQFSFKIQFPLAFSPLEYFILNIIFIYSALNYFLGEGRVQDVAESAFNLSITENLNKLSQEYNISGRETEIIHWIVQGYNNPEIGAKLFISPNTVKNHIYSIYKKLGVKSRYELINVIMLYRNAESDSSSC
jgi:DNA-binding CsgD family transcriptional regulator